MSISQNYLSKVGMQKHQVDLGFFGNNNSDPGSLTDSEERSESLIESVSIKTTFPANKSDTDGSLEFKISPIFPYYPNSTDGSLEFNEISPIFTHYPNGSLEFNEISPIFPDYPNSTDGSLEFKFNEISPIFPDYPNSTDGSLEFNEISPILTHYPNSIWSYFPPARSCSDSENNYEIIFPYGSSPESNETQFSYSIMSFFPPARSQSDISENFTMTSTNPSISASPIPYGHTSTNQNSIVSFFSPARSSSVSENHYEIIFPNPSIPTNGPTSLSISLLFPPTMSETETYGSSSESNETQFSYSIMSFFPPARSQSDISDNFTMISTNPSMSASPIHTIEAETFLEYFSLQMLLEATNNFSEDHKIPTSSFGSVYRATLDDGREVAIKRAEIAMFKPCVSKHYSVLKTLSRLSHKNLVPFLGFCGDDNDELVLVYDYMRNGSLHDHLHKLSTPLKSWVARIKVALDVARGIEYLHIYAIPPIIHGDIKLSNILLDATWDAKVTDFGLSLMVPMPAGTVGYMDPECHWLQQLTTKSDVYGFGVLLLQMLSGYNTIHFDINGVPWNVVDFVVPYIVQDKIYRVLDPKVPTPTPVVIDALAYVGYLAVDCVSPDGLNRPSMTEIAKSLQRALDVCLGKPIN